MKTLISGVGKWEFHEADFIFLFMADCILGCFSVCPVKSICLYIYKRGYTEHFAFEGHSKITINNMNMDFLHACGEHLLSAIDVL